MYWAASLQAILALVAVLALMVGCAKLAQRLPMVRRLQYLQPRQGMPVTAVYPLDAQSRLRILQFAGKEYRILHSGGRMLLLESLPAASDAATLVLVEKAG